jgi:Protein of unknown function (DUF2752)
MELDRRVLYACLAAAVTAATLAKPESVEGLPSVCAFRRVTGLPCPGCGLTRSWVLTANGRFRHASERHPFGPPTFLVSLLLVMRGPRALPVGRLTGRQQQALTGLAAVWLSWGLVRMARDAR